MPGTASSARPGGPFAVFALACLCTGAGAIAGAALGGCGTNGGGDAAVHDERATDDDGADGGPDERPLDAGPDGDGAAETGDGGCPARGTSENTPGTDLLLGTGRDSTLEDFRALADGDRVYVAPGEQGLQHVVIALRGRGYDPALPLITARLLRRPDCEQVGYLRFRLPFRQDPQDPQRLAVEAVRVVMQDDLDPLEFCSVLGRDVDLVVDLDDLAGKTAHRERRLHVEGIDPATRSDVRMAYMEACARRQDPDAGLRDAAPSDADGATPDAGARDARAGD